MKRFFALFVALVFLFTATATTAFAGTSTSIAPVKISKSANANGYPIIKWTKSSNASGYCVYRAQSKTGSYKKIATISKTKRSYTDKNISKSKTYYYKVKAYKLVNSKKKYSKYSNIISCKIKSQGGSTSNADVITLNTDTVTLQKNASVIILAKDSDGNSEDISAKASKGLRIRHSVITEDGGREFFISIENPSKIGKYGTVEFYRKSTSDAKSKILKVFYDESYDESDTKTVATYQNIPPVPDFGVIFNTSPISCNTYSFNPNTYDVKFEFTGDNVRYHFTYSRKELLANNPGKTIEDIFDIYTEIFKAAGFTDIYEYVETESFDQDGTPANKRCVSAINSEGIRLTFDYCIEECSDSEDYDNIYISPWSKVIE